MSNKLTVDEILKSHSDYEILRDVNKFSPEQMAIEFPDKLNFEGVKAQLSQLVNEIIGNDVELLDGTYITVREYNDEARVINLTLDLQRQRAIKHGFVLENIDE